MRDKLGKPTQLGRLIEDLLEEDQCKNITRTVCQKCRYKLLHLRKFKREYEELKGNLKSQLQAQRQAAANKASNSLQITVSGIHRNIASSEENL